MDVLGRRAGHERERAAGADEVRALARRRPRAGCRRAGAIVLVEAPGGGDVGDADPQVVDVARRAHLAVMDGLDAVAVGVEQEGAVVVVAVLGPRAGGAVVAVARLASRPARTRPRARASARRRRRAGAGHRLLRVGGGEREVVPLGEASSLYVVGDAERLRAPCRRSAGRPRDRRPGSSRGRTRLRAAAQLRVLAHESSASGSRARAPRARGARACLVAFGAAARARGRCAGPGSRDACPGRPRTISRARAGSLSASAPARNDHSHADGVKVGGPPKLSTVVPGSAATAWRCVAGSGTKT